MRKANADLGLRAGMLLALHSYMYEVRVCGWLGLYSLLDHAMGKTAFNVA